MRATWSGLLCVVGLSMGCGGGAVTPAEPDGTTRAALGQCERVQPGVGPVRIGGARQGSAVALARMGDHVVAYVADADARELMRFDITDGRTLPPVKLRGAPAQVMVLADGRVALTIRDANRLSILEPSESLGGEMQERCTLQTHVEPFGLAATPDDRTLVISSAYARKLTAYDAASGAVRFSADVAREPRAVVVDDDGARAFVSHVVGGKMSVVDLAGKHDVREIDLRVTVVSGTNTRGGLRSGCQGFALAKSVQPSDPPAPLLPPPGEQPTQRELQVAPDVPAGRIFAPRVTIDPGDFNRQTENYYDTGRRVESPIVNVIDSAREQSITTKLIDPPRTGFGRIDGQCMLPRDATMSARTGGLLVACVGSDAIVEFDPRGVDPARLERRRWKVPAGPLGIAVDDQSGKAVAWSQFDRMLSVIDLEAKTASSVDVISAPRLAKSPLSEQATWGREIYHATDDLRISRDGTACASCHPDGREDALTWPTPKGPRQTIMLAGRLTQSAPFSWLGEHKDLHAYVKNTMSRLGGSGLPDSGSSASTGGRGNPLDALIAYLHEMPAPNLDDALSEPRVAALAERGRELFFAEAGGCAGCHVGGIGTDGQRHDLASAARGDAERGFDTPSLRFVAGSAPFFHDGRYATLMDLLRATDSQMGHSFELSQSDVSALAAYLERL